MKLLGIECGVSELDSAVKRLTDSRACNVSAFIARTVSVRSKSRALYRAGILELSRLIEIIQNR